MSVLAVTDLFVPIGMANRTTLVDNNTWNNSHIALVGKAMSSTEDKAYPIMRMLGVDYVLVIFGGMIGYSGDDINKFLWMVRIAEGEHPQDIKVGRSLYTCMYRKGNLHVRSTQNLKC